MTEIDPLSERCQAAEADHRIANHLAMLASYVRLKGTELVRRDPPPGVACLSRLPKRYIQPIRRS